MEFLFVGSTELTLW